LVRFRVRVQIYRISENYVAIDGHPNKGVTLVHELSRVEKRLWLKG